ncbi:MAG: efflux RND transporter permease subunit, partial [Planctomycetaceae bacterium]|nr:efflux RND transporter permease subunit [Planctomycetaceae bacterium]
LENIFHCIEEKKMAPGDAAIKGTKEIGLAVMATTLSLVIVFLPVAFLSSVTGRMLYQFGVTATVAILVSLFVSFTLTPMMCSRLLKKQPTDSNGKDEPASRRGFYHWIEVAYLWMLAKALRWRWLVLIVSLLVMLSNIPLTQLVNRDYIPLNVDESEFEVRAEGKEGVTLVAMREVVDIIEARLQRIEGIETVLTSLGTRNFGSVNRVEFFIRLRDSEERTFSLKRFLTGLLHGNPGEAFEGNFSQRDKMAEVRKALGEIPGLRASVRNLTSLRQGAPVDIDFAVTGPEMSKLLEFCDKLAARAKEIPGIVDVYTTLRIDNPELLVQIDRDRAAAMGIDVREIADTLRIAVGGDDRVSRYRDETVSDAYDVELRLVGIDRNNIDSISQLFVRAGNDAEEATSLLEVVTNRPVTVRMDNLVHFEHHESASRVDRLNRQRMVAVRANIAGGYALADRIDALRAAADEIGVPSGYGIQVLGGGRELERTLADFGWTFILSFILMYIVLAAQYENLIHPFVILLSLPLAVPFGLLSLHYGGETLNLYSALGILVLFGVVKKAAILQVDHTNVLRSEGLDRHTAIMQANRDRLRPILMTTISFVAGLLPLLIATGPGAEERRSIAVLAVGGQTFSLLLTLLAIPVLYTFFDDIGAWLKRTFRITHRDELFETSNTGKVAGAASAALQTGRD